MKILNDEIVFDGKYTQMIRRHFLDQSGKPQVWEVVRRKTLGNVVSVAAITPRKEIVLERIFRIPMKQWVIELPAGLMDIKGEGEEEAARRELLEETGYAVKRLERLIAGPLSSGLSSEMISVYLGTDAKRIQEPCHEDAEKIEVITVPTHDLLNYLTSIKDAVSDAKLPGIIPFLQERNLI